MPIAFKEWSVTVRALAEGEQLVTLRKGGIREDNKHFELEHEQFFLYPTFDHQPAVIPADVLTTAKEKDRYGWGSNRGLSPAIGFPALTVPAGFTTDALPVGLELLGRPFTEEKLLGFGYAFEQATHYRRPPSTTPRLPSGR